MHTAARGRHWAAVRNSRDGNIKIFDVSSSDRDFMALVDDLDDRGGCWLEKGIVEEISSPSDAATWVQGMHEDEKKDEIKRRGNL